MKYATTIFLFEEKLPVVLDWVADAGFEAVDIPGETLAYPVARVREALASYDDALAVGEVTGVWGPERDLIHPDPKTRGRAIKYAKDCIEMAADLGANLTHLCFMTTPHNLDHMPRETLARHAVSAIQECHAHAREYGVTLLVEPLFQKDVSLVNRAEQAVSLWEEALGVSCAELPALGAGLLLDAYHMHFEERSIQATIRTHAELVRHVHLADHDRNIRFRDHLDFVTETLCALREVGYSGYISLEPIPLRFDPGRDLAKALATLKRLEGSL